MNTTIEKENQPDFLLIVIFDLVDISKNEWGRIKTKTDYINLLKDYKGKIELISPKIKVKESIKFIINDVKKFTCNFYNKIIEHCYDKRRKTNSELFNELPEEEQNTILREYGKKSQIINLD